MLPAKKTKSPADVLKAVVELLPVIDGNIEIVFSRHQIPRSSRAPSIPAFRRFPQDALPGRGLILPAAGELQIPLQVREILMYELRSLGGSLARVCVLFVGIMPHRVTRVDASFEGE